MATHLPSPNSTIDVSGLPEPVVQVVRDLVDTLRRNLGGPAAGMGRARKPLGGRLAHLNLKVPNLDEFQQARRETWADFPHDLPESAR
jgi:hypothetical protein